MIRTIWVLLAGGVLTFTLSAILFAADLLRRPSLPNLCERLGRFWARGVVRMAGVRIVLESPPHREWPESAVIVANHQSWFDVFSLAAVLPITYRFVAKEELSRIPVFGQAWQACGHISLDRGDRREAINSLDRAAKQQVPRTKTAIVLFPEGTRSPDGRLRAFKKGAFVLAINHEVPIVPVGISGTRKVMPKGSFRIRPGEVRIRVGDPIPTEGLTHRDRNDLLRRARQVVVELMDDPDALSEGEVKAGLEGGTSGYRGPERGKGEDARDEGGEQTRGGDPGNDQGAKETTG